MTARPDLPAVTPIPGLRHVLRDGTRTGRIERDPLNPLGAYPFRCGTRTWTADGRHHAGQAGPSEADVVGYADQPARHTDIDRVSLDQYRRCVANMGVTRG